LLAHLLAGKANESWHLFAPELFNAVLRATKTLVVKAFGKVDFFAAQVTRDGIQGAGIRTQVGARLAHHIDLPIQLSSKMFRSIAKVKETKQIALFRSCTVLPGSQNCNQSVLGTSVEFDPSTLVLSITSASTKIRALPPRFD
jgi:hypothetical protein